MQLLNLLQIPNQSFVTTQNGNRYQIRIIQCNGNMCADITMNGIIILQAARIVSGTPLIPFNWMAANGGGNFIFACQDENCIDYSLFGVTQFLYYATLAELQSVAAPPPETITLTGAQQDAFLTAGPIVPTGYLPLPP